MGRGAVDRTTGGEGREVIAGGFWTEKTIPLGYPSRML